MFSAIPSIWRTSAKAEGHSSLQRSITMLSILNLKKVFTLPSRVLDRIFQYCIAPYESIASRQIDCPPIFIIGAPRSGSTLLVQAITEAFDIGYMSNCHCKWYGAPALAEKLFQPTRNRAKASFESFHGSTKGPSAPSECGQFWYRFFRRKPAYISLADISKRKLNGFLESVSALISTFGKPVIFKNLYAGLRLQPIVKAFPNSLFIIVKRDEIDNSHSILEGRLRSFGNYDHWWSVEPPNVEQLKKLLPHQQVVEQIRSIYRLIEADLNLMKVRTNQIMHLSYEEFCSNPGREIDSLALFFSRNGLDIPRRAGLPDFFSIRKEIRIDPVVYQRMADYSKITSGLGLS